MINTSSISDVKMFKIFESDDCTYNQMRKDLCGNKLAYMIIFTLVFYVFMIVFFIEEMVMHPVVTSVIAFSILLLDILQVISEESKLRKFAETEEFNNYSYLCDYGKLDSYAKLYNNTLCTTSWQVVKYKNVPYIKFRGLSARLTDDEYYDLSNKKDDSLAIIRGINYREKMNGKILLIEDVIKVVGV